MQHYEVYGWHIESELLLPCLQTSAVSPPDVTVRVLGARRCLARTRDCPGKLIHCDGLDTVWQLPAQEKVRVECAHPPTGQSFRFDVHRASRRVDVAWTPQTPVSNLALPLVSSLFAALLWDAGHTCLHGAVLGSPSGRGALILGGSGAGKSTTTLALMQRGFRLVTDDIAVLRAGEPVQVPPGPAYLRMWNDTARAFGKDLGQMRPVFEPLPDVLEPWKYFEEFGAQDVRFARAPQKIDVVFVLGERKPDRKPEISLLSEPAAVKALMFHRYERISLSGLAQTHALQTCVELAQGTRVYSVRLPQGLANGVCAARELASTLDEA